MNYPGYSRYTKLRAVDGKIRQDERKNKSWSIFKFTDLTSSKLRPALVLYESADDVIVAFISSKVPSHILPSDLLLSADHPAFPSTGLKTPSVIKFDKVATVSKDLIEGEIGKIFKDPVG